MRFLCNGFTAFFPAELSAASTSTPDDLLHYSHHVWVASFDQNVDELVASGVCAGVFSVHLACCVRCCAQCPVSLGGLLVPILFAHIKDPAEALPYLNMILMAYDKILPQYHRCKVTELDRLGYVSASFFSLPLRTPPRDVATADLGASGRLRAGQRGDQNYSLTNHRLKLSFLLLSGVLPCPGDEHRGFRPRCIAD
jgi:hypothetical protein